MSTEIQARQDQDLRVPRQGILILGMHRSGTSAVARVVNLLGAAAPADLMPATPSNPRGHWESNRFYAIHEELLKAAGTAWDDWRPVDSNWFESSPADTYREQLKSAIVAEYGENRLIYIKDPRICRLVPFWLGILHELNITPSVLFSVRNPLEVAYSLASRDGFSLEKSLLLWLRHTLDAEYATRNLPRSFVEFEQLMLDWQTCMVSAGTRLGISWPNLSNATKTQIEEFLDFELRHHSVTTQELRANPDLIEWVADIYESIVRYLSDGDDLKLQATFNIVRERFEEGCNAFGAVLRSEEQKSLELSCQLTEAQAKNDRRANEQCEKIEELEAKSSLLNDELQFARIESEKLKATNESLNVERTEATNRFVELEAKNGLLNDELQSARAEREKLRGTNQQLNADIERCRQVMSRYEAMLERFSIERAEATKRTAELVARRRELEEQNAALVASTSWRVTRPLRWIGTGWKTLRNSR
jgi:hypothetical protein